MLFTLTRERYYCCILYEEQGARTVFPVSRLINYCIDLEGVLNVGLPTDFVSGALLLPAGAYSLPIGERWRWRCEQAYME